MTSKSLLVPGRRAIALVSVLAFLAACSPTGAKRAETTEGAAAPGPLLTGTVRSETGEPLPGVTVSAKLSGGPVTVSVFTDAAGEYFFPQLPAGGRYVVRAQAAAFEKAQSEQTLNTGIGRADFVLKPTNDYLLQLSGWQQIRGLPERTREERRGKAMLIRACTGCHQTSRALAGRFDESGWGHIVDAMGKMTPSGRPPSFVVEQRQEIAAYLTKVRGPGRSIMTLPKPVRPSGEALYSTVYEYDIPNYKGGYALSYGSDWSEGPPPGAGTGISIHDATVDFDGNLWFTSPAAFPGRSIAKLDGDTGALTSYAFPGDTGADAGTHAVVTARDGTIWFNVLGAKGYLAMIDPKTGARESYRVPAGMRFVGGWVTEGANGDIWASTGFYDGLNGALRFDRKTKRFEEFKSLKEGMTYGIAGDAKGDGWWAQINTDRMYHADRAAGKVEEIAVPFGWQGAAFLQPGDMTRKEYLDVVFGIGGVQGGAQMPRRLKPDPKGDSVWVGNWAGNNLMRVDTTTLKLEFYPAPYAGMMPYDVGIDSQRRVWVGIQNGDEVARFDPDTKAWTLYPLPTKGVSARSIMVVERAGRIEVVVPANDANKVIRLIPGTAADARALKERYRGTRS